MLVWLTEYTYALSRICLRDYFVGSQTTSSPFHSFVCGNIFQITNLVLPISRTCCSGHIYLLFHSSTTMTRCTFGTCYKTDFKTPAQRVEHHRDVHDPFEKAF